MYHRQSKDVPCVYQGQIKKLLGCDRLSFILLHLHNQLHRNAGKPIYSSYKKFATYYLSSLNMSVSTVRRELDSLLRMKVIIKEKAPTDLRRQFGFGKRDNTRCWSINYELLSEFGITPAYMMKILKGDKRLLTKNFAAKKIEQTLKKPPLVNQLISNYIPPQEPKLSTCQFKNAFKVRKMEKDESISVDRLTLNDRFIDIARMVGYHAGRIEWEFVRFKEINAKTGLKQASEDAFAKTWKLWLENGIKFGFDKTGYKFDPHQTGEREIGHMIQPYRPSTAINRPGYLEGEKHTLGSRILRLIIEGKHEEASRLSEEIKSLQ